MAFCTRTDVQVYKHEDMGAGAHHYVCTGPLCLLAVNHTAAIQRLKTWQKNLSTKLMKRSQPESQSSIRLSANHWGNSFIQGNQSNGLVFFWTKML